MSVYEKMTSIAAAIREKTGEPELLTLDGMAEAIPIVYEKGRESEYDRFWDAYQNYGKRRYYASFFNNEGWDDQTFDPKYDIVCGGNAASMLAYSKVTNIKKTIDVSNATGGISYLMYRSAVKTVTNLVVAENIPFYDNTFGYCEALEDITITGTIGTGVINFQWSTKLSKASITSIINALSDTKTGMSITFSQAAKEAAFTADEWSALIATKPNWTINLV